MSTALGLAMQISANTAQLGTAVQDINKRLDQMADSGKKAANDLGVLKNLEIAKAFISGITAVANGLTKAASGAKQLFDGSRQAIDEIGKLSSRTGVSVEAIQSLQLVATEAGTTTEKLAQSLGRLGAEIGLGAVEGGADKVNKKFELLGLTYQQLEKLSPEEQFFAVADAVAAIENQGERIAAVTQVFGQRSGQELVNVLQQGGDALREMSKESEALGGTLDARAVKAVETMNDQLARVGQAFSGITNQVTAALAEPIAEIAVTIQDIIKDVGVENIGRIIAETLLSFAKNFLAGLKSLISLVQSAVEGIRKLLVNFNIIEETQAEKELASLQDRQDAFEQQAKEAQRARIDLGDRQRALEAAQAEGGGSGLAGLPGFDLFLDNTQTAQTQLDIAKRRYEQEQQKLDAIRLSSEELQVLARNRSDPSGLQTGLDQVIATIDSQLSQLQAQPDAPNVAGQTVAGREDSAIEQNREQLRELRQIRQVIREQRAAQVDILG